MKCAICSDEVREIKARDKHLVITKSFVDDHIHIHGDIDQKDLMKQMLETASGEIGIEHNHNDKLERKEIVFHNRQRIGDILMFTCAIRDFKAVYPDIRVNVISTAMHIWDHNPRISRDLKATEENTLKIGPGKLTNSSNRLDWHFANAYRVSIEDALKVHLPQGESRPDIWFTEEEYNAPRITPEPYWIIIIGGEKGWGCKMYPFEKWQAFVSQNPDTLFYQLGSAGDDHPRLQGKNIVDYIGKTENRDTGIRDLFKLFLNAEGSIGLVSFHMHLSGALYKPSIVIAGAREPVSFTRYPGHQYLATDGCLPCAVNACWHCDINACKNLIENKEKTPKCVDMIQPEDLTKALNNYYIGGRLKKGVVSVKPKLRNITKTPLVVEVVKEIPKENKYGIPFGGGALTSKDWDFIQETIKKYNPKTVLEFGCGLSTLLLSDIVKVVSYETNQGWIDKIKAIKPELDIRLWDGVNLELEGCFDVAFVDGPSGGASREISTKIAGLLANVVIIHDAGRENERKWQESHIKPLFDGPGKGGHRCHLWTRKAKIEAQNPPKTGIVAPTGKFIKIVSTARGWGGQARSLTTIMKFLLKAGHKVEFIPFRNKVGSREFQDWIKEYPDLTVTENYDTVKEACDVLFMYADDYIWEFDKPEISQVFSVLQAERKIMMLNYRRGSVGQTEWTKGWDKYMFLNSTQEKDLLKIMPGVATKVLPPCTELEEFLSVTPDYNHNLRVVRHSSQGDTKFYTGFSAAIGEVLASRTDVEIAMLPGPSFVQECNRFRKIPRTANVKEIAGFLSTGNLFWYSLPVGYMDMGPRVILEAMAAGLPILADNWGGAIDRVTPECGWLCDSKEAQVEIIANITAKELEQKGKAARARAQAEFIPEKWINEILI